MKDNINTIDEFRVGRLDIAIGQPIQNGIDVRFPGRLGEEWLIEPAEIRFDLH